MHEAELLDRLASDLDAFFPQLVSDYQHQLYTYACQLSRNPQDAEELVLEAFTHGYYALATYPASRVRALQIRGWLQTITRNLFYNRLRKPGVATLPLDVSEGSDLLMMEDEQALSPEEAAEQDEVRRELDRLLHTLPSSYREVLLLYYFEQLSYYEIARLLEQPAGTVKSTVHRGVRLLRERLGEGDKSGSTRL